VSQAFHRWQKYFEVSMAASVPQALWQVSPRELFARNLVSALR